MNKPWSNHEKVRRLANVQRTITYIFEQISMDSDNWRINNNLRSVIAELNRYIEVNPDEKMPDQPKVDSRALAYQNYVKE